MKPSNVVVIAWLMWKRSCGVLSRSLIVRATRSSPPIVYASLIFARPRPGISTARSRGTDSTVIALCLGSIRTSIIVSDRASPFASPKRWSDPTSRIVCGLPGAASVTVPFCSGASWLRSRNSSVKSFSWSSPAVATAPPVRTEMSSPASSMRSGRTQGRWRRGSCSTDSRLVVTWA
jgi:hypothetical protein